MQDLRNYIAVIFIFLLFALIISLVAQLERVSGYWVFAVAVAYVTVMLGILTVLFKIPLLQKIGKELKD